MDYMLILQRFCAGTEFFYCVFSNDFIVISEFWYHGVANNFLIISRMPWVDGFSVTWFASFLSLGCAFETAILNPGFKNIPISFSPSPITIVLSMSIFRYCMAILNPSPLSTSLGNIITSFTFL